MDTSGLAQENEEEDEEEESNDEGEFNGEVVGIVPKKEQQTASSSTFAKSKTTKSATKKPSSKNKPKEKKSVHRDYSMEDKPKVNKRNTKKSNKCPFEKDHKKCGMRGLSEEQIIGNLDSGYLKGATCSVCKKVVVHKTTLTDEEKAKETMFNAKLLLFTCENFRATNYISCRFCMCRQCYIDIFIHDEKGDQKGARRSGRNRK